MNKDVLLKHQIGNKLVIDQKDFVPKTLSNKWFDSQVDSFDSAVAAANEWIEQEHIDVINIETIVIPVRNDDETETASIAVDLGYTLRQFIRVWYRKLP